MNWHTCFQNYLDISERIKFMRVNNVKVTMDIPVHFNQSDKNGYAYTKES